MVITLASAECEEAHRFLASMGFYLRWNHIFRMVGGSDPLTRGEVLAVQTLWDAEWECLKPIAEARIEAEKQANTLAEIAAQPPALEAAEGELPLTDVERSRVKRVRREMDELGLPGLSEAQCLEFEDVIAKLIALPEERLRAFKAGLAKLKSWLPIWEAIQEGPPPLKQKQKAISKLRKGLALLDGLAPKPKPVALAKPKFDEFLREMGLTTYAGFDGVRLRRDVPIDGMCLSDLIALELTRTQERGVREEFAKRFPDLEESLEFRWSRDKADVAIRDILLGDYLAPELADTEDDALAGGHLDGAEWLAGAKKIYALVKRHEAALHAPAKSSKRVGPVPLGPKLRLIGMDLPNLYAKVFCSKYSPTRTLDPDFVKTCLALLGERPARDNYILECFKEAGKRSREHTSGAV